MTEIGIKHSFMYQKELVVSVVSYLCLDALVVRVNQKYSPNILACMIGYQGQWAQKLLIPKLTIDPVGSTKWPKT